MSLRLERWTGAVGDTGPALLFPVATLAWPDRRESGVCWARPRCVRDGLKYPVYSTSGRVDHRSDAQLQQLVADAFRSPQPVFARQALDQGDGAGVPTARGLPTV